ncbi:MAG TPA: hypothetical protein VJ385_11055 [Fibrobacteria bacterium]|nr:hypothetical protein [Fibrobacteria bacterium]
MAPIARILKLLTSLLLAGALGPAAARPGGLDRDGTPSEKGVPPTAVFPAEAAKQRLERVTDNFSRLQSQPAIRNTPDVASQLANIQDLIAKARESLNAGNTQAVFELCAQIDKRIGDLFMKEKFRVRTGYGSGPGGGDDSERAKGELKARAELDFERAAERFASLSQRLGAGKNPCAAEVMGRIKALLDKASQEIAAGRPANSRGFLAQVEALTPELQRLAQESSNSEKQGASALAHGSCEDQQPSTQAALAQASETYHRLLERFTRLTEQSAGRGAPKSDAVKARVQEFLDKAKEALATGRPEAAREFCLKAESLLPELRVTVSAIGGDRLTPAAWQRLKAKLDRAAEIVSTSGNDKAAKILEKGQEHFERAERNHAEGQAARAEVEMDIALKLAAKAVDIARTSGR